MIFGIVAYAGSGKTTLVSRAIRKNNSILRESFSKPIVQMLSVIVPSEILLLKARWNEPLECLNGMTIRHAAQTLGTEWGRECIHPDFWIDRGLDRANSNAQKNKDTVFDLFVANIENAIETKSVSYVFEAALQAVQNIENERLDETENEEFFESQEYKNLQHCKTVIEYVMSACNLDITYGYAEARKIAMERFEEAMRDELPNTLREQG
jgi:GTPase SAR1 family protein